MTVPQALHESRQARGVSQSAVGAPYGQQMISEIERGNRKIAADMAPRIGQALDDPAILLELAREMSGGWGPAWLNGPNVDLHRAVVREMCLKELHESIEAVQQWSTIKPPVAETEGERKRRYQHLLQIMDNEVALSTYIGIQCREYGFSMLQLSRDHYARLKGKRYVRGD
ncbi:helix-turn-helix transcriptional regulator [Alicyclobacillus sp. ALC3]|nr:helix-turn-helix transcriptional regulator [Alicyclobacillus sp. ALC3]